MPGIREQREQDHGQRVRRVAEEEHELLDEADLDQNESQPDREEEHDESPLAAGLEAATLEHEKWREDEDDRKRDREEQQDHQHDLAGREVCLESSSAEVHPELPPLVEIEEERIVVRGRGEDERGASQEGGPLGARGTEVHRVELVQLLARQRPDVEAHAIREPAERFTLGAGEPARLDDHRNLRSSPLTR